MELCNAFKCDFRPVFNDKRPNYLKTTLKNNHNEIDEKENISSILYFEHLLFKHFIFAYFKSDECFFFLWNRRPKSLKKVIVTRNGRRFVRMEASAHCNFNSSDSKRYLSIQTAENKDNILSIFLNIFKLGQGESTMSKIFSISSNAVEKMPFPQISNESLNLVSNIKVLPTKAYQVCFALANSPVTYILESVSNSFEYESEFIFDMQQTPFGCSVIDKNQVNSQWIFEKDCEQKFHDYELHINPYDDQIKNIMSNKNSLHDELSKFPKNIEVIKNEASSLSQNLNVDVPDFPILKKLNSKLNFDPADFLKRYCKSLQENMFDSWDTTFVDHSSIYDFNKLEKAFTSNDSKIYEWPKLSDTFDIDKNITEDEHFKAVFSQITTLDNILSQLQDGYAAIETEVYCWLLENGHEEGASEHKLRTFDYINSIPSPADQDYNFPYFSRFEQANLKDFIYCHKESTNSYEFVEDVPFESTFLQLEKLDSILSNLQDSYAAIESEVYCWLLENERDEGELELKLLTFDYRSCIPSLSNQDFNCPYFSRFGQLNLKDYNYCHNESNKYNEFVEDDPFESTFLQLEKLDSILSKLQDSYASVETEVYCWLLENEHDLSASQIQSSAKEKTVKSFNSASDCFLNSKYLMKFKGKNTTATVGKYYQWILSSSDSDELSTVEENELESDIDDSESSLEGSLKNFGTACAAATSSDDDSNDFFWDIPRYSLPPPKWNRKRNLAKKTEIVDEELSTEWSWKKEDAQISLKCTKKGIGVISTLLLGWQIGYGGILLAKLEKFQARNYFRRYYL